MEKLRSFDLSSALFDKVCYHMEPVDLGAVEKSGQLEEEDLAA